MTMVEKVFILSGTLWLSAMILVIYMGIIHARQQRILGYIARRLNKIETLLSPEKTTVSLPADMPRNASPSTEDKPRPETTITIDKGEPLSKYESVNLPDEIDITFVDR